MNTDLSIIVPVFNEEENVQPLYEAVPGALADLSQSWELLLVDDGSDDRTFEIAAELASRTRE